MNLLTGLEKMFVFSGIDGIGFKCYIFNLLSLYLPMNEVKALTEITSDIIAGRIGGILATNYNSNAAVVDALNIEVMSYGKERR